MTSIRKLVVAISLISAPAALAQSASPHFKAEGKTFTTNTGCSPHAPSVVLALPGSAISTSYVLPESGSYTTYVVQFNSTHTIAVTVGDRFSGQTNTTQVEQGDAAYESTLAKVKGNVGQVLNGNVCAPGVSDLQDVEDYLSQL